MSEHPHVYVDEPAAAYILTRWHHVECGLCEQDVPGQRVEYVVDFPSRTSLTLRWDLVARPPSVRGAASRLPDTGGIIQEMKALRMQWHAATPIRPEVLRALSEALTACVRDLTHVHVPPAGPPQPRRPSSGPAGAQPVAESPQPSPRPGPSIF
jgi:hypothetical protein